MKIATILLTFVLFVVFLVTGYLLLPADLYPQTAAQDTMIVTFQQAQEIALEKNPQLLSAEKDIEKASAGVMQSFGNLLPDVSAYTNYNHNFELPIFTIEFGGQKQTFRAGRFENITSGFQIQQPLYTGGAIWSGYNIARRSRDLAENQKEITRQQVLLQVRQTFYNALYTKELIAVAREAVNNVQRNLEQVQKQHDAGTASGFDLLRAKVNVANTRPQLIAAQHQHEQSITRLRTAIGLDKSIPISVQGSLEYDPSRYENVALSELQQAALQQRPEMQNIHLRRRIQTANVRAAMSNYLPTLSFISNLQYQAQQDNLDLKNEDFIRSISAGVNISIPLFTGGTNYGQIQQAKIDLRQVDDREQQVENQIAAEVESGYYSLLDAREKIESQSQTIQQAQESLRLAELNYREGTATQLDILNAQLALQQAQTNYSQYLLQYNVASDQLSKAINELTVR
ncbi:MAG TPA: TolC family protein [bacterium]|nr:TolC family protein [bacterium]